MNVLFPSAEERRELLEDELERYLPIIVELGAEKIILVGSLATGRVHGLSDLDLIIILETEERFLDRIERFRDALSPQEALDLFVYTPREFEELRSWSSFLDHALKTGKFLYDGEPYSHPLPERPSRRAAGGEFRCLRFRQGPGTGPESHRVRCRQDTGNTAGNL